MERRIFAFGHTGGRGLTAECDMERRERRQTIQDVGGSRQGLHDEVCNLRRVGARRAM